MADADYGSLYQPLSENPLSLLSYLPVSRSASGDYSYGVPGVLKGAAHSISDAATLPQRVMEGYDPTIEDIMNMTGVVAGAGAGVPVPRGSLRIFGGVGAAAEKGSLMDLDDAKFLHDSGGHRPEDIFHSTGWFKDIDGQWKFEIPDSGAKLRGPMGPDGKLRYNAGDPTWTRAGDSGEMLHSPDLFPKPGAELTLGDVLHHPALYNYYPALQDIPLKSTGFNFGLAGAFDPEKSHMLVGGGAPDDVLSTLLHETQHAVQHYEGFAKGGSQLNFLPEGFEEDWTKARDAYTSTADQVRTEGGSPGALLGLMDYAGKKGVPPESLGIASKSAGFDKVSKETLAAFIEADKKYDELRGVKNQAFQNYLRLSGEVEARNVEERHKQGYDSFPLHTEGYPSGPQLLKYDYGATPAEVEPGSQYNEPEYE